MGVVGEDDRAVFDKGLGFGSVQWRANFVVFVSNMLSAIHLVYLRIDLTVLENIRVLQY